MEIGNENYATVPHIGHRSQRGLIGRRSDSETLGKCIEELSARDDIREQSLQMETSQTLQAIALRRLCASEELSPDVPPAQKTGSEVDWSLRG